MLLIHKQHNFSLQAKVSVFWNGEGHRAVLMPNEIRRVPRLRRPILKDTFPFTESISTWWYTVQLVPTVVVNANRDQEILARIEVPPAPKMWFHRSLHLSSRHLTNLNALNIDQMIAESAKKKGGQRNRHRSSSIPLLPRRPWQLLVKLLPRPLHRNRHFQLHPSRFIPSTTIHTHHEYLWTCRAGRFLIALSDNSSAGRVSVSPDSTEQDGRQQYPIGQLVDGGYFVGILNRLQSSRHCQTTDCRPAGQWKSWKTGMRRWGRDAILPRSSAQVPQNLLFNFFISVSITALLAAFSRGVSDNVPAELNGKQKQPAQLTETTGPININATLIHLRPVLVWLLSHRLGERAVMAPRRSTNERRTTQLSQSS